MFLVGYSTDTTVTVEKSIINTEIKHTLVNRSAVVFPVLQIQARNAEATMQTVFITVSVDDKSCLLLNLVNGERATFRS